MGELVDPAKVFAKEPMKIRRPFLILASLLLSVASLLSAQSKPAQKAKGPTPKGSCAVCGMYVANFPDWAAVVSFRDGTQAWFDGPKDLFTYLLDLKRYAAKRNASDITAIQVKDYYGLKHIDARRAFYVLGSDVMGPMGKELVPFATEAGAKDFLKDHRGQKVLPFQEISVDTLKGLE
jgi:nitrous oxide reductase accessory protein NosL